MLAFARATYAAALPHPTPKPDDSLDFLFLHRLWRNLAKPDNSKKRPALPTELIIFIFRLADICLPISQLNTFSYPVAIESSGPLKAHIFLQTRPLTTSLTRTLRTSLARLEINITSRDQGWVSDPQSASHSWFEIGLCHPPYGLNVVFECGENNRQQMIRPLTGRIYANQIAGQEMKSVTVTVSPMHKIWKCVEVGDAICFIACAQYGWANYVKEASFQFFKYFEPVL